MGDRPVVGAALRAVFAARGIELSPDEARALAFGLRELVARGLIVADVDAAAVRQARPTAGAGPVVRCQDETVAPYNMQQSNCIDGEE